MPPVAKHVVLLEHAYDAADRRADEDPGARRIEAFDPSVCPRLTCGRDSEHDVAFEPARVLRPDDRLRLEALYLGRDPDREVARVEGSDPVDAAVPGDRRIPRRLRVEPERGDGSETGDDHAAHEHESVELAEVPRPRHGMQRSGPVERLPSVARPDYEPGPG